MVCTFHILLIYVCHSAAHTSCAEILCCRSQIPSLLTVIVGLLLLLYTIDDVRCVMVWCESYVVVMDQFCEKGFMSAKVTVQELQNPV